MRDFMHFNTWHIGLAVLIFALISCKMEERIVPNNMGEFKNPLSRLVPISASSAVLEAKTATIDIGDIKTNNAALFNNTLSILTANAGEQVNIKFINTISQESNIHWHGILTPSSMDGHPKDVFKPNSTFNYSFKINQRAATTWFHPHPHGRTASQVYSGLAGLFILRDDQEKALNLPSDEFELPILLSDKRFSADGSLDYSPTSSEIMTGYLGDRILVNNAWAPVIQVKTRMYRLRIVNGSNARIYDLAFSNNKLFYIIGNDGGLMEKPVSASHALLGPGERLDIISDFSKEDIGTEIFLQSNANSISLHGANSFKILKFQIVSREDEKFVLPAKLSVIEILSPSLSKRQRAFSLPAAHMAAIGGGHTGMHTINGRAYDINRIDESVKAGDVEIWEIDNSTGDEPHPMHIHGVQFQIIEKIGGRIEPYEKGWKDTALLKKGEKLKIIMRFPTERGIFLFHCHNLEHEDDGMMMNFEIK